MFRWWLMSIALLLCLAVQGRAQSPPPSTCWPERIEGLGTDVEKAKQNAFQAAQEKIRDCLRLHTPPLVSWVPTTVFIDKNLVDRQEPGPDPGPDLALPNLTARRWFLYLKPPDWDTFRRLDGQVVRSRRSEVRLLHLARVFAGVVAILAGVLVYVRLDDWTHRAYTRLLQAAAAALVAAAWAGLWLLV